jgi:hypothetical protein
VRHDNQMPLRRQQSVENSLLGLSKPSVLGTRASLGVLALSSARKCANALNGFGTTTWHVFSNWACGRVDGHNQQTALIIPNLQDFKHYF